jgi:hypothetical protein
LVSVVEKDFISQLLKTFAINNAGCSQVEVEDESERVKQKI